MYKLIFNEDFTTYYENNGKYQKTLNMISNKISSFGRSENHNVEKVRQLSKIYYRAYNDGDVNMICEYECDDFTNSCWFCNEKGNTCYFHLNHDICCSHIGNDYGCQCYDKNNDEDIVECYCYYNEPDYDFLEQEMDNLLEDICDEYDENEFI